MNFNFLPVFISLMFFSSCGILPKKKNMGARVQVEINSYADKEKINLNRYIIYPADENISLGSLEFKEFSSYVKNVLDARGFIEVSDVGQADILLFFSYGIGEPKLEYSTRLIPEWGQVGIVSNTTGSVSGYGNSTRFSSRTSHSPQYGLTGFRQQVTAKTVYTRFVSLFAYSYSSGAKDSKSLSEVWRVVAESTGNSNDLRFIAPLMIAGSADYIAKNSRKRIKVNINENDPKVQRLLAD